MVHSIKNINPFKLIKNSKRNIFIISVLKLSQFIIGILVFENELLKLKISLYTILQGYNKVKDFLIKLQ